MARKKMITHDQILNGAYQMVLEEGFEHFTSRHVAEKLKCSTQPIYVEFKNMEALKREVMQKISSYMKEYIFKESLSEDPVVNVILNYIRLATEEKALFNAVYMENNVERDELKKFAMEIGREAILRSNMGDKWSDDEIEHLIMANWVVAQGLAVLVSSGILNYDKETLVGMIEVALKNISNFVEEELSKGKVA